MADYIDRNELVGNLDRFAFEHFTPLIRTLIEKQPTVDVEEVVRCKDCIYAEEGTVTIPVLCNKIGIYNGKYDFCSYGKRSSV